MTPITTPAVAPGGPVAAGAAGVVVPGGAVQLAAAASPQGVVHCQVERGVGGDHDGADEVQQHQSELVSRPACGGKEPVGQVVVAPAGQPRTGEHPGDGMWARLGQEAGDHGAEGRKRRRGEAGRERDE
jgi:hypothetical protein